MKALNISRLRRIAHAMVERDNREAISLFSHITGRRQSGEPKPKACFRNPPEGAKV